VIRAVFALVLAAVALSAVEIDRAALNEATWIGDTDFRDRGNAVAVLCLSTTTPGAHQTAVEVGKLARAQRDRLQVVALSAESTSALTAFRAGLGLEMGYPLGQVPEAVLAGYTGDARGLPHCLLLAADGSLLWQGHPRLLPQVVAAKLP